MLLKPCSRCGKLIQYGGTYCPECKPIAIAQMEENMAKKQAYKKAKYNKGYKRDPKYLNFYRSKAWKQTSRAKLSDVMYRCEAKLEGCTHLAVEVHHIKPIQTEEGWNERLEWSNLEAVCTSCHNRRHVNRFKRNNDPDVLDMKEIIRNTQGVR